MTKTSHQLRAERCYNEVSFKDFFFFNVDHVLKLLLNLLGFPGGSEGKEPACNAGGLGSIPRRRKWQPTLVLLPGEFHGGRSLVGIQSMGLQRFPRD